MKLKVLNSISISNKIYRPVEGHDIAENVKKDEAEALIALGYAKAIDDNADDNSTDGGDILDGTIDSVVEYAEDLEAEQIQDLIEAEKNGKNRKGLITKLEALLVYED